jgi:hypothetical protein
VFEKISNAAEKLATNVSESRRGFLARVGQAALGVTSVAAGLLALPTEAQAAHNGYCGVRSGHGSLGSGYFYTLYCLFPGGGCFDPSQCPGAGGGFFRYPPPRRPCTCP